MFSPSSAPAAAALALGIDKSPAWTWMETCTRRSDAPPTLGHLQWNIATHSPATDQRVSKNITGLPDCLTDRKKTAHETA